VFKVMDKKWDCIRIEEGTINGLISSRGRRGVTVWEDSEDDTLPQHLTKPGDIAYSAIIAILSR
jgi:hypothetical protein